MFGGMHNGFFGGMGGMGILGGLIALFFFIGIVLAVAAVVVALVRNSSSSRTATKSGTRPALEVLQERYARGELSREEYLRMREDLG
jgi:putative membrane protein